MSARLRRGAGWLLAGLGLYVALTLVLAPANAMAWLLYRASQGRIELEHPAGSFWHGRANALLIHQSDVDNRMEKIAWNVRLAGLLHGRGVIDVSAGGETGLHVRVQVSPAGVDVQDLLAAGANASEPAP